MMYLTKTGLMSLVGIILLCLVIAGPSSGAPGDPVIKLKKPIATVSPNDRCADATEITLTKVSGTDTYRGGVTGRKFQNGNNVDDWYKFTSTDRDDPDWYYWITVELKTDNRQVEVEFYKECWLWPELQSFEMGSIYPLSGLTKTLTYDDREPKHTYYVHVNCVSKPASASTITYDLTIAELGYKIPI